MNPNTYGLSSSLYPLHGLLSTYSPVYPKHKQDLFAKFHNCYHHHHILNSAVVEHSVRHPVKSNNVCSHEKISSSMELG
jgi:hypothetical protein